MGDFVEALTGGAVWGIGFALALGAVRSSGAGLRGVTKAAIRGGVTVGDWVRSATAESRETLQDIYHEAKADRRAGA